jgi:ribonuclease HII
MNLIEKKDLSKISNQGDIILGLDEVGWGALAGPCVVCGVKANKDWDLKGLNDSKKMTFLQRKEMSAKLMDLAKNNIISFFIAERSNKEMDAAGPGPALNSLYVEVIDKMYKPNDIIILDGTLKINSDKINKYNIFNMIKADQSVSTVKAASIIAKFYRDSLMINYSKNYPNFNFDKNFGYYSEDHVKIIEKYGFSDLHRKSYKIKKLAHLY